jgi:hypothetical protein
MRVVILPLAVVTLLLSGCTALDDLDQRLSSALGPNATDAVSSSEPFQPLPERKPTDVPPVRTAAVAPKAPVEAPKPEPAPLLDAGAIPVLPAEQAAPATPERGKLPETLVGVSADQLRARFGAPDEEIEETPGVTWRYRPKGCVLDVHLFPRVESQGLYALDVSAQGLPVDACLTALTDPTAAAATPAGGPQVLGGVPTATGTPRAQ